MDHTKMPMSEVLTPDEKLVADFIKTRTKKVLDDIQRLSKEQNADISEWAESFAYLARTYVQILFQRGHDSGQRGTAAGCAGIS